MKNKYFLILILIVLLAPNLEGQGKDNSSKSKVKKDRSSEIKGGSFAEAMKEIEEVRKRDVAKEILRINKKVSVDRLHEDLRNSVRNASDRLSDKAIEKIKSKVSSAESFAEDLINKGKRGDPEVGETKIRTEDKPQKINPINQELGKLPIPPDLNSDNSDKINPIKNPSSTLLPERVRADKGNNSETVIEADGRLIFDGSSSLGEEVQVVIFEDNVVMRNPDFMMKSDRLEARFQRFDKNNKSGIQANSRRDTGGGRLELAEATGREVVVTRILSDNELQVAKAGKVTYKAKDINDEKSFDEVVLEIYPSVQRGRNRVIAKSIGTRIILKGDEMIVEGPVRTQIVGSGFSDSKDETKGQSESNSKGAYRQTIIDAEKGAVFNRMKPGTKNRELFFEGNVSVVDPGFDLFSEKLTAYVSPFTNKGVINKAVALGTENEKVQVQRRSLDGEVQLGKAGKVTFLGDTEDMVLDDWPEIRLNEHSSVATRRDAQIILKKDGSVVSRGVGTKIIRDKEER